MSSHSPAHILKGTILAYGFLLIFMYHVSYAQQTHVKIQVHPATYFEQASTSHESSLHLEACTKTLAQISMELQRF